MAIEHGDIVSGDGHAGTVVGIDGPYLQVRLFPPKDQPDMACEVVRIGPEAKLIRKAEVDDGGLAAAFANLRTKSQSRPGRAR